MDTMPRAICHHGRGLTMWQQWHSIRNFNQMSREKLNRLLLMSKYEFSKALISHYYVQHSAKNIQRVTNFLLPNLPNHCSENNQPDPICRLESCNSTNIDWLLGPLEISTFSTHEISSHSFLTPSLLTTLTSSVLNFL